MSDIAEDSELEQRLAVYSRRHRRLALVGLLVMGVAATGFGYALVRVRTTFEARFRRLAAGATMDDVRRTLGEPTTDELDVEAVDEIPLFFLPPFVHAEYRRWNYEQPSEDGRRNFLYTIRFRNGEVSERTVFELVPVESSPESASAPVEGKSEPGVGLETRPTDTTGPSP